MIRKTILFLITAPIALLIIALSVANRQIVTVSLDPFGGEDPMLSARLPLFILLFLAVLAGMLAGGMATWIKQGKWRRAARAQRSETGRWQDEVRRLRRDNGTRALPVTSEPHNRHDAA